MAMIGTDYLQEVDAASTPKMAPTTPMQVLQKPQQARDLTNALPSLLLGGHSELKRSSNTPPAILHTGVLARPGPACKSTASKLHSRKEGCHADENPVSFCLSEYEKKYQTADTALCKVHAHAGHSNMLLAEVCASPHIHTTPLDTHSLSSGLGSLPEERLVRAQEPKKKVLRMPTSATGVSYDTGVIDSAAPHFLVPGEVALDAYELYSKMFPSLCAAAAEHSPPPTDTDMGPNLRSPFLDHMRNTQPLRSDQKRLVRDRCEHSDEPTESEKKIKFLKVKEEDTVGEYLDAKKEPIFVHPCRSADIKISSARLSQEDTKPFRMPPESMSTPQCSLKLGKVGHFIESSGGFAGHTSAEEVTNSQPVVGLKLFTSSACTQMPKRECSVPPSSEPSIRVPVQGSSLDADWGKYLALSATPARSAEISIILPFQERFKELQAFLKQCDEGDQNECIQVLRALSSSARSGYAVELETRAIRLSLEEGKEMKRMRLLNVLGRISEGNLDTTGATPQGPRLPAPGAVPTPKHVL